MTVSAASVRLVLASIEDCRQAALDGFSRLFFASITAEALAYAMAGVFISALEGA